MNKTLLNALNSRYATKVFNSQKISEENINILLETLRLTPTSYGLQLMKVVVVENDKIRKELLNYSYNQKQVVDASHLLILCREDKFSVKHIDDYIQNISEVRQVTPESLEGFKTMLKNFKQNKSKNELEVWMNNQIYIALGNLLTACALLKIDACPMEGFIPSQYDKTLRLEQDNLKSVLVIPIGYSSEKDFYKSLKKVRRSTKNFILKK